MIFCPNLPEPFAISCQCPQHASHLQLHCIVSSHCVCSGHTYAYLSILRVCTDSSSRYSYGVQIQTRLCFGYAGAPQDEMYVYSQDQRLVAMISSMEQFQASLCSHVLSTPTTQERSIFGHTLVQTMCRMPGPTCRNMLKNMSLSRSLCRASVHRREHL